MVHIADALCPIDETRLLSRRRCMVALAIVSRREVKTSAALDAHAIESARDAETAVS